MSEEFKSVKIGKGDNRPDSELVTRDSILVTS